MTMDLLLDKARMRDDLVQMLARALRLEPRHVKVDRPFTDYGLDSIAALTIAGELEEQFDIALPETLLWDCPTIEHLANHLHGLQKLPACA